MSEVIEIQIRPGMSEATDPRLLPMAPVATPRLLQNLRARQLQRLEKRPGTASLTLTGFPETASALWLADWSGLVAACVQDSSGFAEAERRLYVRDAAARWNECGRMGFVVPERRVGVTMDDTIAAGAGFYGSSCVTIGGMVYVAWADASDVHLVAMDPQGVVLRETTLTTAGSPRLVYADSVLYLVTKVGTDIKVQIVTLTTLAIGSATTIGTATALGIPDAAPFDGAATWLLAYPEDATHIRVRVMGGVSSIFADTIVTTSSGTHVSVVGTFGEKIVVTYTDGLAAEVSTFGNDLSGAANVTLKTATGNEVWACQSGVVRTGANEWHVVYGGMDEAASPLVQVWMLYHGRIGPTGAASFAFQKGYRFLPCSKPFTTGDAGDRKVSIVAHDADTAGNTVQSSHCIIDLEMNAGAISGGGQQFAAMSYEHQPWFSSNTRLHNVEVPVLSSGQRVCPIHWFEPNGISGNAGYGGIDLLEFRSATVADSVEWSGRAVREVSGALLVSGGALYEACSAQFSDLHYVTENGFPNDPIVNTLAAAGGSLTADREYTYVVTYAWVDPLGGRLHESAPSAADTVTPTGADLSVTVRIATIGCTGRFGTGSGKLVARVWRSWLGGPFYHVATTTAALSGAVSVTVTDTMSDASAELRARLYTDGNIFANDPPSGARLLCEGGNRVFTVGWKERVVEASKVLLPTTPVEFADRAQLRIVHPERLTALWHMDGALVAFSARHIYVTIGDGPTDQGVGQFAEPRRLPSTVGADSPHVVEVPQGLIFKGAGTLWLLPRGFGPPQPIGNDIQETISSFPYLRSVARCSNSVDDCTHFVLAASDSLAAETKVAVWDNRLGTWMLDDVAGEIGTAAAVNGLFTWLLPTWTENADFAVRQFSAASAQDYSADGVASWIEWRIGFGDWRPAGSTGLAMMQSVVVHGDAIAATDLKLTVTVNHGTPYTVTWERTTTGAFYVEHKPRVRRATSVRFDLYDSEHSGSGKTVGAVVHALRVLVDPLEGGRRVSPAGRAA